MKAMYEPGLHLQRLRLVLPREGEEANLFLAECAFSSERYEEMSPLTLFAAEGEYTLRRVPSLQEGPMFRLTKKFVELYKYRMLIQTLVSRELKARYRGTFLGFFWSFINPLLLLIVYTIVFGYILGPRMPEFGSDPEALRALSVLRAFALAGLVLRLGSGVGQRAFGPGQSDQKDAVPHRDPAYRGRYQQFHPFPASDSPSC